jgi:hypothetical protein
VLAAIQGREQEALRFPDGGGTTRSGEPIPREGFASKPPGGTSCVSGCDHAEAGRRKGSTCNRQPYLRRVVGPMAPVSPSRRRRDRRVARINTGMLSEGGFEVHKARPFRG